MKRLTRFVIVSSLLVMLFAALAQAETLTVGWTDTNPAGTIAGFNFYISATSGGMSSPIWIAGQTTNVFSIPAFEITYPAQKYYLSMTAKSKNGLESDKCPEVIYTRPTTSSSSSTTTSMLVPTGPAQFRIIPQP
jgi:hypothetical protein